MKLSFVVPTYNTVTWLPHAVTSALDQTHKDIEVIIVDDGSTDRTWEYLDWIEKKDKRVKVIRNKTNLGRSEARNIGNRAAQGEIICVLDADDLATPNRAELTAAKFSKSKVDYVYGAATVGDALGNPKLVIGADVFDKDNAISRLENGIIHSTAAYTREFAAKYPYPGGEFSKLGADDWHQQITALLDGAKFDYITHRLAFYRVFDGQVTKTRDKEALKKAKLAYLESLKVTA